MLTKRIKTTTGFKSDNKTKWQRDVWVARANNANVLDADPKYVVTFEYFDPGITVPCVKVVKPATPEFPKEFVQYEVYDPFVHKDVAVH